MKVLLWDIDGTLINSDGAGKHAWLQALEEENGGPVDATGMVMAGQTDPNIARLSIEQILGREYSGALAKALLDRYVELLPSWLERRDNGFVFPGVRAILEHARTLPDVSLALLTGNLEAGGKLKLAHYDLLEYFEWGAFADVAARRRDIARAARRQAESLYGEAGIEALYVIGDTEHDIDCGKAIGARTIAVGTGPLSAAQLGTHDPWWATDELPAPQDFFARLR